MGSSPLASPSSAPSDLSEPRWRVIASAKSWIETEAVTQLAAATDQFAMIQSVGLPDIQPGRGAPSGAAYLSAGAIAPSLIGTDIGCGYAMAVLDLPKRKLKRERAVERLADLERFARTFRTVARAEHGLDADPRAESQLGTVGGGNHFVELLEVERLDADAPVERDQLVVLAHSGSRGLGGAALNQTIAETGVRPVDPESAAGKRYLAHHDHAVRWARANRQALIWGAADALRATPTPLFDLPHNLVEHRAEGWLHRKGAQPADAPWVAVPGSRGDYTHLARPIATPSALWCVAHGAGRKWARGAVKARLGRASAADLRRTALGGHVICGDRGLLFDEAPEAYKKVDQVMADLVAAGLVQPLARLKPVITFKRRHMKGQP